MGKQTVSADSGSSGSYNENADIEIEEASEEKEPSEDEPVEEDPSEDETQEVNSCEEPDEDPSGTDEENIYKQELDEVASCEVDPNEEDSSEEHDENVSREEEPNEKDSCESPREEACTGERNEESCEEEIYEEDEKMEEQKGQEPSEEETDEEEPCEEPEEKEPCEEETDEEEPCEELEEKEPCEEETDEEEPVEVETEEEEPAEGEPDKEELSENPKEKSSKVSPVNQSYSRNNESSDRSQPGKMTVASDIPSNNVIVSEKVATASSRRKRRSRWDVNDEANEIAGDNGSMATKTSTTGQSRQLKERKSRWSRWSNDDSQFNVASTLKSPGVKIDIELPKLHAQLLQITQKLQSGVVDDRPEGERSPSPPPIYNNLGLKINTREARLRSKLMIQRQTIISKLIKKNPNFKPPTDYKSSKFQKKLYIPVKEYPGYNFIGLVLGPCGNTQKRMEKETGARILIRGKGSKLQNKPDPSDAEDLHVLIEADERYSLDAAVAMVEKLLIPVEHGHNSHKLAQLRELAELKGTLRVMDTGNSRKPDPCNVCGDTSHPTSACPLTAPASWANSNVSQVNFFAEMGGGLSTFSAPPLPVHTIPPKDNSAAHVSKPKKEIVDTGNSRKPDPCNVCGDTSHPTSACPLTAPASWANSNVSQVNFFAEMGGGLSPFSAPPFPVPTVPPKTNSAADVSKPKKESVDANLFVCHLPSSVDDNKLIELFSPFGPLYRVQVIRDRSTGLSQGYGFVDFACHIDAAKAVAHMNGYKIDGKMLEVRIAGTLPSPVKSNTSSGGFFSQFPSYASPAVIAQNNPDSMHWPGPSKSRLPETVASFSNRSSLPIYNSPLSGQYSTSLGLSCQTPTSTSHFSADLARSDELAQFPGYLKSFDPAPQMYHQSAPSSSLSSPRVYFTQNPRSSYHMPPS